jgi:hypothetical protein
VRSASSSRPALGLAAIAACLIFLQPVAARADELTRLSNASFALTVLDMATTRLSIAHTNGSENNPLARPFVRSDVGALGYAVLTTALERVVFHRHPRAFIGIEAVEAGAVVRNYTDRLHALDVTRANEAAYAQH